MICAASWRLGKPGLYRPNDGRFACSGSIGNRDIRNDADLSRYVGDIKKEALSNIMPDEDARYEVFEVLYDAQWRCRIGKTIKEGDVREE